MEEELISENSVPQYATISKDGKIKYTSNSNSFNITAIVPKNLQHLHGTHKKVRVYETSITPNCRIINALTGIPSPFRVGSIHENLFFKVAWITESSDAANRKTTPNLFFYSPDEYERELFIKLPDHVKKAWNEKIKGVFGSLEPTTTLNS